MQELCKSHYPGWGICYGYVESFRQFCQAEISLFSPPSTTYFPHETRKAACISAASDAQPKSLSLLRGQRKHALRPLHNREYAANCPFSVARTHRFRHRKSPDSDFSFERNSGPVLPWAQGARASPPAPRAASRRVKGASVTASMALPAARMRVCPALRATPQTQSQMQWKTRFFPQGSRDTGKQALTFCAGK